MLDADAPVGPAIQLLRTQSLSALAQREIERMVVSGELRAGERVNENALALRLGISRGPIREACRALAQAGLLDSFVNRGVFVRRLGLDEVNDLYDIRASLAALAGRALARVITAEQVATVAVLLARMADEVERDDVEAYYPLNLEFHDWLLDHCGNRRLAVMYRGVVKELSLFRQTGLTGPGALTASNAEHRAIVEALGARDADGAGRAMARHVERAKQRMLKAVAAQRGC